jgi:hypothetical protein
MAAGSREKPKLQHADVRTRALKFARRIVARPTARWRVAPDWLVIGVKRGGSTAFHTYITEHPDVVAPNTSKTSNYFGLNHHKGWTWYRSHFPTRWWVERQRAAGRTLAIGETASTYCFHPLAMERIARELPDVRLIMVVRDPVDRAYSHYSYEKARGNETLSFEDAIAAEPGRLDGAEERMREGARDLHWGQHSYVTRGYYADQIERVHALFPAERLKVVVSEELFARPLDVMNDVFAYLGLSPLADGTFEPVMSNRYDKMAPETREYLAEVYAPHNERLYTLLGRELAWTAPAGVPPAPAPEPAADSAG